MIFGFHLHSIVLLGFFICIQLYSYWPVCWKCAFPPCTRLRSQFLFGNSLVWIWSSQLGFLFKKRPPLIFVTYLPLLFFLYQMNRKMEAKTSQTRKMEELSVKHPTPFIPKLEPSGEPDLQFDRLQTSDQDLVQEKKFEFGRFIAREAILDEELWVSKLSRWWHLNHEVFDVYAICVPWIISCGCMLLD